MIYKDDGYLLKIGDTVKKILIEFLSLKVGDRIPTVQDYCKDKNISRGTYFNALIEIEKNNLILFKKNGRSGTVISYIDYVKIWIYLGFKNLTIAMPYPKNIDQKRLATAFNALSDVKGINFFVFFLRGSKKRYQALDENLANIIVQSNLSWSLTRDATKKYMKIYEISSKLYHENVSIFVRKNEEASILNASVIKVLIDSKSLDINHISNQLFKGKKIIAIEHSYAQSFDLLLSKTVDIIVHSDVDLDYNPILKSAITKLPLDNFSDSQTLLNKASTVSLVSKKESPNIKYLIDNIMNKKSLEKILLNLKINNLRENY